MIPLATARDWVQAGAEYDAVLQLILDGVVAFLAKEVRYLLLSPPQVFEEYVDVPERRGSGLSGLDPEDPPRIRLGQTPQTQLTGTVSVSEASAEVVGDGTRFTLEAAPGAAIRIGPWDYTVVEIADDESLTLGDPAPSDLTGVAAYSHLVAAHRRFGPFEALEPVDVWDFELSGRTLHPLEAALYPGFRTCRLRYRVGFLEGSVPADVQLLVLDLVKSMHSARLRRSKSISVDGAISVTWADFGDGAKAFESRVRRLRQAIGFAASHPGVLLQGSYDQWPA